jgi:hypothetical protein
MFALQLKKFPLQVFKFMDVTLTIIYNFQVRHSHCVKYNLKILYKLYNTVSDCIIYCLYYILNYIQHNGDVSVEKRHGGYLLDQCYYH